MVSCMCFISKIWKHSSFFYNIACLTENCCNYSGADKSRIQVRNVQEHVDNPPVSFSKGTSMYKEVKTLKYTRSSM